MVQTRSAQISLPNGTNDNLEFTLPGATTEETDLSRWRLLDESGRHTWHYLKTEKQLKEWPQNAADKYHLGLPTVCSVIFRRVILIKNRIYQIYLGRPDLLKQLIIVLLSIQNYNYHPGIGLANTEVHYSYYLES